jgi:hypothetical protein
MCLWLNTNYQLPNGLIKVRRRWGQRHPQGANSGSNGKLKLMLNSKQLKKGPGAECSPFVGTIESAGCWQLERGYSVELSERFAKSLCMCRASKTAPTPACNVAGRGCVAHWREDCLLELLLLLQLAARD